MSLLPVDSEEFSFETRDASPCHLLTKIKSFSNLSKHEISKLESAEFEAGDYKWKLTIYVDGDDVGKKTNHISVHLSMVGTSSLPAGWEVNASFNFFIYNHMKDNYLCFRGKVQRFQAINLDTRVFKVIDMKTFLDPFHGYVFKDNCVFGAEVFVLKNQRYVESVSVFDVQEIFKCELEISDFSKLEKVWSSEEFFAGGYNWRIDLHPNGDSRVRGHYVSIFLRCVDSKSFAAHTKVRANYSVNLKNRLEDGENHSKTAPSNWFTSSQSWGWNKFIAIRDMHDKGFLVKDCCLLEIRLTVEATQEALN